MAAALPRPKRPTAFHLVGELPLGATGKVARRRLRELAEAALAAYPGGIVDRVVEPSNGEYEVHYIGVNWPPGPLR